MALLSSASGMAGRDELHDGPAALADLGIRGEALASLPATPLVFAAYAVAWIALVLYVFGLWRKLGRVERELQDLRSRQARRQG